MMPYGTEGLHVLRAEKGFIMIGDETDGTVIPQDLNLDWAISKKKADYLGKRGQERTLPGQPRPLEAGGVRGAGRLRPARGRLRDRRGRERERPAQHPGPHHLDLPFADAEARASPWACCATGPRAWAKWWNSPRCRGEGTVKARVVSPVFFDPEGERNNA
jgi:sarcosine oxidase subunit alpha